MDKSGPGIDIGGPLRDFIDGTPELVEEYAPKIRELFSGLAREDFPPIIFIDLPNGKWEAYGNAGSLPEEAIEYFKEDPRAIPPGAYFDKADAVIFRVGRSDEAEWKFSAERAGTSEMGFAKDMLAEEMTHALLPKGESAFLRFGEGSLPDKRSKGNAYEVKVSGAEAGTFAAFAGKAAENLGVPGFWLNPNEFYGSLGATHARPEYLENMLCRSESYLGDVFGGKGSTRNGLVDYIEHIPGHAAMLMVERAGGPEAVLKSNPDLVDPGKYGLSAILLSLPERMEREYGKARTGP
jgi:hypothetical protein